MKKKWEILPKHIAIIPDANRRWAKERGLEPWEGHEAGAKNIEELVKHSLEAGVRCLSFWGSSVDNLTKRPLQERLALLDIYKKYFKEISEAKEIFENEVRINIIGRWREQFPDGVKKILEDLIEKTKHHNKRMLNFFLAYNGDDEMIQAISNILEKVKRGTKITSQIIKDNLMTKDLPAVDYLIRTGGEPHLSTGFMMWETANAQLYFSEEKFPDFGPDDFNEALLEFERRERRLGR